MDLFDPVQNALTAAMRGSAARQQALAQRLAGQGLHARGVLERSAVLGTLDGPRAEGAEQHVAALVEPLELVHAPVEHQRELLVGERRQAGGDGHDATGVGAAATCAHASRSSPRRRTTRAILSPLRSRRASRRQRLQ